MSFRSKPEGSRLERLRTFGLALALGFAGTAFAIAANDVPLIERVKQNDGGDLGDLLAGGADPNQTEPDGSTALLWASHLDDLPAVEALIGAGADASRANDLGATPLWAASQNGNADVVRALLAGGADPNRALLSGETPLMVASRAGVSDVITMLVDAGADIEARGSRGQTALMWAAAQKHSEVVRVLLERGADVHARSDVWELVEAVPPHSYLPYNMSIPHGGDTALLFAARSGDLESARMLVEFGGDIDDADAWGISAVNFAAHSDFTDLVAFLLDAGADPNQADPGFTPLHNAIMWRDEAMVRALLDHGADPNAVLQTWTPERRTSQDWNYAPELVGAPAIWLAARFGGPEVTRLVAEAGADPTVVHHGHYVSSSITGDGHEEREHVSTLLTAALGSGGGRAWVQPPRAEGEALALEFARLAVELGVDLNFAGPDGRTALDMAARMPEAAAFLEAAGAVNGEAPAGGRGRGGGARP
jgi:ankyrin repeat protein